MVKTSDAIKMARSLIGTPYSEMDCIGLIRAIIKRCVGGDNAYRCQGTNWLWDSVNNSGKYKHLTERHEGLAGIPAGALPFKRYGADGEDHVGIATGDGTVIHSSSVKGCVVETPLTADEGWDCWGIHKHIETAQSAEEETMSSYKAKVIGGALNLRNSPAGRRIGQLAEGTVVTVECMSDDWAYVLCEDGSGYVMAEYLERVGGVEQPTETAQTHTSFIKDDGTVITLVGVWRLGDD